jgi:hypothetical protein
VAECCEVLRWCCCRAPSSLQRARLLQTGAASLCFSLGRVEAAALGQAPAPLGRQALVAVVPAAAATCPAGRAGGTGLDGPRQNEATLSTEVVQLAPCLQQRTAAAAQQRAHPGGGGQHSRRRASGSQALAQQLLPLRCWARQAPQGQARPGQAQAAGEAAGGQGGRGLPLQAAGGGEAIAAHHCALHWHALLKQVPYATLQLVAQPVMVLQVPELSGHLTLPCSVFVGWVVGVCCGRGLVSHTELLKAANAPTNI